MSVQRRKGLTFIELMLSAVTMAIILAAILGAYMSQVVLDEHSRNLMFAMQDANRVMEGIRAQQAGSCGAVPPNSVATVPACAVPGTNAWDAWLQNCGGGKTIPPDPVNGERIVVTCRDNANFANYCGAGQVSPGEWKTGAPSSYPTLEITVAVCWRHRGRTIGECSPAGALVASDASDTDADGVIESPATLTTTLACPP